MASTQTAAAHPRSSDGTTRPSSKRTNSQQKRKRTKTGCLTCRKRRIKCDEGQPICANCIRSHRQCEGYKAPLVFRTSNSVSWAFDHYNPSPFATSPVNYYPSGAQNHAPGFPHTVYGPLHGQLSLQSSVAGPMPHSLPAGLTLPSPSSASLPMSNSYSDQAFTLSYSGQAHSSTTDYFPRNLPPVGLYDDRTFAVPSARYQSGYVEDHPVDEYSATSVPAAREVMNPLFYHQTQPLSAGSARHTTKLSPTSLPPGQVLPWVEDALSDYQTLPTLSGRHSGDVLPTLATERSLESMAHHNGYQSSDLSSPDDLESPLVYKASETQQPTVSGPESGILQDAEPLYMHSTGRQSVTFTGPHPALSFELDPYFPRVEEMLLGDPYTKSAFQHFMRETGSMLTAFDRSSPFDPPILDRHSQPLSYPGLWTYTMPMMALKNVGLLHGMLALASLQIAQKAGESTTPSWKHYTYAWRKVHSAVREPEKRRDLGVFAATMLLAYYEVATANHSKWNMHLSAAGQLIREIGLGGMSKQLRLIARERAQARLSGDYAYLNQHASLNTVIDHFADFDMNLVSELMGEPLYSDDTGDVWQHNQRAPSYRHFSTAELAEYPIYQDLFWWYIRHDMIHAMVGGTDLLLDYRVWTECPPRAPLGHGMAHYGSFDYLMLLMGRLMVWAQKDRPRKMVMWEKEKAANAAGHTEDGSRGSNNSHTTLGSSASSTATGDSSRSKRKQQGPAAKAPMFYGMAPTKGRPPLPHVFETNQPTTPVLENHEEDPDIEQATSEAFDEWNSIRRAFDTFKHALGPEFEPLPEEECTSFDTPFGPALIYRTHGIACLMAWYYTALIVALRAQPNMPPYATMAVTAATSWTTTIANTIGRVLAGIRPDLTERPLKPSDAGPIGDCAIPLLFAAVQYMEADQRAWTIDWFRRADELTGFASIPVCANGCEGAWRRMAEAGRGPPYMTTLGINEMSSDSAGETSGGEAEAQQAAILEPPHDEGKADKAPKHKVKGNFVNLQRGNRVMRAYQLYSGADALGHQIQRLALGVN